MGQVRDMLTKGNFNDMSQSKQSDGSVLVTLIKRGDPHVYKMWVTGLYTPQEAIIKEEITP